MTNNQSYILIISCLFILIANTTKGQAIFGLYGKCTKGYFTCTQIKLNADSTFCYYSFYDVGGEKIRTGKWTLKQDTLIMNTYIQPKHKRSFVIIDSSKSDKIEIQCLDRDSIPISFGHLLVNHCDTLTLDINGKTIYHSEIQTIKIMGLGVQKNTFTTNKKQHSKIVFFVDRFICLHPDYLTDEKLILKNKELKTYSYCNSQFVNKGLKKTAEQKNASTFRRK